MSENEDKTLSKKALYGAIGLMAMSWLALPIIYYLLKEREKNKDKKKLEEVKEKDGNNT